MTKISDNDPDRAKGATEGEERDRDANAGLAGQLGHRDQDPLLKDADTDFPEPGESPEHSSGGNKSEAFVKKAKKDQWPVISDRKTSG
jgi:hypothetical protein